MNSYNIAENISICADIVNEASKLLFYSHIPTAGLALLIGLYILVQNKSDILSRQLAAITILFAVWCALDLTVWLAYSNSRYLMFAWSLLNIVFTLIFVCSFYFVYVFVNQKDISLRMKLFFIVTLLPLFLFLSTKINLVASNATDCVAIENPLYSNYYLVISLGYGLSIIAFVTYKWKSIEIERKKIVFLLTLGIESFLLVFYGTIWGVGYLIDSGYFEYSNYNLEQYGLFSMPAFMAFLAYLTVRYKMFNVKLVSAQVLVAGLLFLIATQFFFVETTMNYVLVGVTLLIGLIGSYYLVESVQKEINQREEIEKLAKGLEKANTRLRELDKQKSEFVSIASHQLRSPLTAMRGYASMLAEGSFGKLPDKALDAANRIEDSAKLMAMSVEDYLNVSRIESGNMKYNLSDFNIREMTDKLCDDLRPEAMKQNLILLFRTDLKSRGMVNADIGKTNQIIHNLINNSIKYTPKGTINVFMRDDVQKNRIYVDITDTGIGMSRETMHTLFQKFSRADNANSVNVSGTGLGLYVAFKMAEAMGGTITCNSEGDGKGSTFTFELPLKL